MIDIGLRGPEDYEMLARTIGVIDEITAIRGRVALNPVELGQAGSAIDLLRRSLPESTVDLRRTLFAATETTTGSLQQIAGVLRDNVPTTPPVLQTLLRTALLSAGRLVYVLMPEDASVRLERAKKIVAQDGRSLDNARRDFAQFPEHSPHRPPVEVSDSWAALHRVVASWGAPPGEGKMLKAAGETIDADLLRRGLSAEEGEAQTHMIKIFHIYSGAAHGYGWTQLLPGTNSMPSFFAGDLAFVAAVGHLALDSVERRARC